MQSYYEMLGVSHDVTPSIAKIAYEGKVKALAKSGLGEAERQAEERELNKAYVTLSNPAKKDWYDNAEDIEEARLQPEQDSQAHIQGLTERQQAAREQAYRDQQARIARDQAFRQQVQSRAINTFDERSAQYNEDRQRRLDLEDERIRAERDYRVQREQALKRARDAAAARQ